MTRPDNTHLLAEAARRRSEQARRRALDAIAALASAGDDVTPTAVAKRAGVSRQWLYTFDEAREAIWAARVRSRAPQVVRSDERPSVASLQRRLEALTEDNQRLRAQVAGLEARLAAVYGEWRASRA